MRTSRLSTVTSRAAIAVRRAIASLALLAPAAAAQPTIEGARAQEREVVAIRAVYQEVTRAVAAGRLTLRDTTVSCGEEDAGRRVAMWRDRASIIRQLTWSGGTEDHAQTHRSYYDAAGRLRFQFVTRGAVNGTQEEVRLYYGAAGALVRRSETRVAGPGYPFGESEPLRASREWIQQLCAPGNR